MAVRGGLPCWHGASRHAPLRADNQVCSLLPGGGGRGGEKSGNPEGPGGQPQAEGSGTFPGKVMMKRECGIEQSQSSPYIYVKH